MDLQLCGASGQRGGWQRRAHPGESRRQQPLYPHRTHLFPSIVTDARGNTTTLYYDVDYTGATSYTYDELDRLLSVASPGPKTVGYRYNVDGNRTNVIYPDGTTVASTIDAAGRLQSLQDWASRTTGYQYFPDGLVQTITHVNATTGQFSYDNARRLTGSGTSRVQYDQPPHLHAGRGRQPRPSRRGAAAAGSSGTARGSAR